MKNKFLYFYENLHMSCMGQNNDFIHKIFILMKSSSLLSLNKSSFHSRLTNMTRQKSRLLTAQDKQNKKKVQVIKLGSRRKRNRTEIINQEVETHSNTSFEFERKASEQKFTRSNQIHALKNFHRKNSLKTQPSLEKLLKSKLTQSFMKPLEESIALLHKRNSVQRSSKSRSKSKAVKSNKLQKRLDKIKEYKFVEKYLSDFELEGLFRKYEMQKIPEIRWSLLVVDQVYRLMKQEEKTPYIGRER